MSSVSPTHQDLSNDTTFSQIKSRVPVPLIKNYKKIPRCNTHLGFDFVFENLHVNSRKIESGSRNLKKDQEKPWIQESQETLPLNREIDH